MESYTVYTLKKSGVFHLILFCEIHPCCCVWSQCVLLLSCNIPLHRHATVCLVSCGWEDEWFPGLGDYKRAAINIFLPLGFWGGGGFGEHMDAFLLGRIAGCMIYKYICIFNFFKNLYIYF